MSGDGSPWASMAAYGLLPDGSPVLLVSTYAEHGRNLAADPRVSLAVAAGGADTRSEDPFDTARVTLAGRAERPSPEERDAAMHAYVAAVPSAATFAGFDDFDLYVLRVERVRWVGGYARMDSVDAAEYAAAG